MMMRKVFTKRTVAFALSFLLLVSLLSGCGQEKSASDSDSKPDSLTEAEHMLLSDWFNYLQYEEHQTQDMLWALSSAKKAVDEPEWDNLQRALTVLETALLYVGQRDTPKKETTDEAYSLLREKYGDDVYNVKSSIPGQQSQYLNELESLRTDLQIRFFGDSSRSSLGEELTLQEDQYKILLEYDACFTAYLIQLLGPSENTDKLRDYVQEYLPNICAYMPSKDLSLEELEALGIEILDRGDVILRELEQSLSHKENDLILLQDALESDDFSVLTADSARIGGLSDVLPTPGWFFSETASFSWLLGDGDAHRVPNELEELTENPTEMVFTATDALREEVLEYIGVLEALGYSGELRDDQDGVLYHLVQDEWEMIIRWDGDSTEMELTGNLPCLAPQWYRAS